MKLEDLKREILDLPSEQKMLLMKEIGPALCDAITNHPGAMKEIMPLCREMMARMREMMGTVK